MNITKVCQECRKEKPTTRPRSLYFKNYVGPCSDSFCYASCDSSSCRPQTVAVCDECAANIGKELR